MACKISYRGKKYDSMKELENENIFLSNNTRLEDFLLLENKISKSKFNPEDFNIYTPKYIENFVNELNYDFADKSGFIINKYLDHVRSKISNMQGVWIKSTTNGHYLQTNTDNIVDKRQSMTEVLNRLSDKFGIEWRFDDNMRAKGRFEENVVYINPNKATLDTLFHEFAHPFLLSLKKDNPELYKRLIRGIKKEKAIVERTKKLNPELKGDALYEEAVVESLGRKAAEITTKQYENALEKFISWIKGIVLDMFGYEYTSFKDVAEMLSNQEYKKTLEKISSETLYQIDENDLNIYLNQLEGKTLIQKQVAERMIMFNRMIKISNDLSVYISPDGTRYIRVTDELNNYDYYKYEKSSDPENKRLALFWGNAIDSIARDALLGKPVSTTDIDPMIAEEIYQEFLKMKQDYPDSIILPQITFVSDSNKLAGTADIVIIHPSGEIEIVDVKTSRYDFKTQANNFPGKRKADSYDRHNAQLTLYRALAETMGYEFVKKQGLSILPIKLEVSSENNLTGWKRPVQYIKHKGVKTLYEKYNLFYKKDKFEDVISNLKKIIQKKINKAESEGKASQVRVLTDILKSVSSAINIEAVNEFVNEAYSTFIGDNSFQGYYKILKKELDNIQFQEDPMQSLSKIYEIHDSMKLYKDTVNEIWKSYLEFNNLTPLDDYEKGSTLDKIEKLIKVFDAMENDFKEEIPKTIASILAKQVTPDVVASIKKNILEKRKKIASFVEEDTSNMSFLQKQRYLFRKKQQGFLIKKLNELEEQFLNDENNIDMEQVILREIKMGGYNDVSMIDRMLSPAISMPNTFLPTFVLTIKKAFEEVRLKNMKFIPKAYNEFERFAKEVNANIDNPSELNKGLFKTMIIYRNNVAKRVLSFIAPIDYSAYNTAKEEFDRLMEQEEMQSDPTKKTDLLKKRLKWEIQNTQMRPKEHIEGVTKIGNTVLIETVPELEQRKLKELGKKAFEQWKESNSFYGTMRGEYRIPNLQKYKENDWEKMNPAQKRYYAFLMSTYLESQSKLPRRRESQKFILPYVDKSSNDRLRDGKYWDALKYKTKDLFMLMEEDMMKENVEKVKKIPVLYYDNMLSMDANDVSTDLIHSILRFKMAADRYSIQNKYVSLSDNLLTLVKGTNPSEEDSEGFKILDKAAKAVGITKGVSKYIQKYGENNIATMLETFIDTQIYGIQRKDIKTKIGGVTIDFGKVADTIMNFASLTQIAVDPLTSLANSLNAQIQIAEEAFAGQFISMNSWKESQKYYNENEMELIRDSFSPYNKSFIGYITDLYDAMQGEYLDEYGHKLSKSAFKAKMNTGLLYAGMHKGEHRAASIMLISLLKEKKIGDKTLFDIHKEEYEKTGNVTIDFALQNRLHAINKRLHGIYNKFDAVELQRSAQGRLLLMYRKFLVPGLKRRFKKEGIDYELGDFTEGMYRTFYKKLLFETGELYKALVNKNSNLTSYEKYNLRRALFEHIMIALTGILSYILMNIAKGFDDDDEKYIFNALLYEVLRVNSELSVYGGVGDINNYLLPDWDEFTSPYKSTSAIFNTISKVGKLYSFALGDVVNVLSGEDIERYKTESGIFQKGDSKTIAALLKLMGISGKNLDTETAIDILALTKGIKIDK